MKEESLFVSSILYCCRTKHVKFIQFILQVLQYPKTVILHRRDGKCLTQPSNFFQPPVTSPISNQERWALSSKNFFHSGTSWGFSIVGGAEPGSDRSPEPVHVLFVVPESPAAKVRYQFQQNAFLIRNQFQILFLTVNVRLKILIFSSAHSSLRFNTQIVESKPWWKFKFATN